MSLHLAPRAWLLNLDLTLRKKVPPGKKQSTAKKILGRKLSEWFTEHWEGLHYTLGRVGPSNPYPVSDEEGKTVKTTIKSSLHIWFPGTLTWSPAESHPGGRRCSGISSNPPSYSAASNQEACSGKWCWWNPKGCGSQSHGCQTPAQLSQGCSLKGRHRAFMNKPTKSRYTCLPRTSSCVLSKNTGIQAWNRRSTRKKEAKGNVRSNLIFILPLRKLRHSW